MKKIKNSCLSFLTLVAVFACISSTAAVKSRTVEIDVVENGELVGKRVIVTCRTKNRKREIFKKSGASKWCDKAFPEMCEKFKPDLSDRVCSSSYRKKLASSQNEDDQEQDDNGDQTGKLKAELLEIEQKRLDIADKILELKRRELELQKTLS